MCIFKCIDVYKLNGNEVNLASIEISFLSFVISRDIDFLRLVFLSNIGGDSGGYAMNIDLEVKV